MRTNYMRRRITNLDQSPFHVIRQVVTDRNQLPDFTPPRNAKRTAWVANHSFFCVFSTIWSPVSSIFDGRMFRHAAVFICMATVYTIRQLSAAMSCGAIPDDTNAVFPTVRQPLDEFTEHNRFNHQPA
jgi:hypothetical protein